MIRNKYSLKLRTSPDVRSRDTSDTQKGRCRFVQNFGIFLLHYAASQPEDSNIHFIDDISKPCYIFLYTGRLIEFVTIMRTV